LNKVASTEAGMKVWLSVGVALRLCVPVRLGVADRVVVLVLVGVLVAELTTLTDVEKLGLKL